jgi:hypothetical protein
MACKDYTNKKETDSDKHSSLLVYTIIFLQANGVGLIKFFDANLLTIFCKPELFMVIQ